MLSVGERFKSIRKELGFNQQQFANELGISQTHVSAIENGRENPSSSLLKLLCAKFSVNEEWLLDGVGSPLPTWDIRTDEGALSKYSVMKMLFEKELRSSTGEDLKNTVQAMGHLTATLNAKDLDPIQATAYRKAICSIMDELEKLTFMASSSTKPLKTEAKEWVKFKNSCLAATNRINQSVKDAVNVYLEKYGEEMKL